jgi:hypothetical protein
MTDEEPLPSGSYNGQTVLIVRPASGPHQAEYGDMGWLDNVDQVLVREQG